MVKTPQAVFRLKPEVREWLRILAEQSRASQAEIVAIAIRRLAVEAGIPSAIEAAKHGLTLPPAPPPPEAPPDA
jgi:predicted transcriptional regulator